MQTLLSLGCEKYYSTNIVKMSKKGFIIIIIYRVMKSIVHNSFQAWIPEHTTFSTSLLKELKFFSSTLLL